jgi:hypothetical protein
MYSNRACNELTLPKVTVHYRFGTLHQHSYQTEKAKHGSLIVRVYQFAGTPIILPVI